MTVLSIITTSFVPYGGLTTVAMNYYRHMDHDKFHIDFAGSNNAPDVLKEELHLNGDRYFQLPERKQIIHYYKALKRLSADYDIVHVHGNSATTVLELMAAKRAGVPKRIAHIHNTQSRHMMLHRIVKPLFDQSYTHAVAVSSPAGEWIFPKNGYTVLKNAIETEKYRFSVKNRDHIRGTLGINEEDVVIGHVGKMNQQKNHTFLLRCFSMLYKREPKYRLLLVGDGKLRERIIQQIADLGIYDVVFMSGMVPDPWSYLSAMDVFVFPSLYEGFGLAILEATANGLQCIASDQVPRETNFANNILFLPIVHAEEEWIDYIQSLPMGGQK